MLLILAAESLHKGTLVPDDPRRPRRDRRRWCCSSGRIYVLLGTNLGARLGFLIAFTGLAGFMVILSLLWCTTASPLNTLKGRIPQWKVQEVIAVTREVEDLRRPRHQAEVRTSPRPPRRPT